MLLSMTMKPLICGNLKPQVYFRQDQPIGVFFIGSITFEPWNKVRKSWAPGKCKTFVWLAIRNRCWTTDRLQKRGLPHPEHCPLCDQEEENIQHILISCVIATCKAILVCHLAAHKLESVDTHKECEFC